MKYLRLWLSSQGFPFRGLWEKSRASSPPASAPKPCKYTLWFAFSPFPPLVLTLHVSELHKILSDPICSPDLNTNLLSLSKLKRMCCRSPQWKVPLQYTECACSHVCRTVLLMNPSEVPAEFLSVAKQLTCLQHSQKDTYITLIKHAFQSTLGTKYPLHHIHTALQVSTEEGRGGGGGTFSDTLDIFHNPKYCHEMFARCFCCVTGTQTSGINLVVHC